MSSTLQRSDKDVSATSQEPQVMKLQGLSKTEMDTV